VAKLHNNLTSLSEGKFIGLAIAFRLLLPLPGPGALEIPSVALPRPTIFEKFLHDKLGKR
jgi:hypothetical protein